MKKTLVTLHTPLSYLPPLYGVGFLVAPPELRGCAWRVKGESEG